MVLIAHPLKPTRRKWLQFGFCTRVRLNTHSLHHTHTRRYDACVGKCADTHIGLVKGMEEKLAAECKKRLK